VLLSRDYHFYLPTSKQIVLATGNSKFLKYHGLFSNKKRISDISAKLNPIDIKKQIANTNQLTFEVTDFCNLKCKYCGYGELYINHDKRINKSLRGHLLSNPNLYFLIKYIICGLN
jgi:hypothetical protein